jgi:hypothetical protein
MPYTVSLKAGHPTGTYRRGGRVFTASAPTVLSDKECTPEIQRDPWLHAVQAAKPKEKEKE